MRGDDRGELRRREARDPPGQHGAAPELGPPAGRGRSSVRANPQPSLLSRLVY